MSFSSMPRLRRPLFLLASAALAASAFAADATNSTASTGDRMRERVLRMTDFFDTMLPGVLEEHNMTLHVRP